MSEAKGKTHKPKLFWDWGTAYDFFISLSVLHNPQTFGLRAAWAAGMRSRLPGEERESLEQFEKIPFAGQPFPWIYTLPDPKDGAAILAALEELPVEDRLRTLAQWPKMPDEVASTLLGVYETGQWGEAQVKVLRDHFREKGEKDLAKPEAIENTFSWFADPRGSGERLLQALRTYHEVFFAEEENRIRPALQRGLEEAQALADRLSVPDLVEKLSQGVRLEGGFEAPELLMAPSFWGTPLLIFGMVSEEREIMLFGARPKDASLVPGELVPDAQLRAPKALSDPTRLRILRYLAEEPLTPTQLSRRLRLRPSTVVHHLDILRLATLVQLSLGSKGKEKRYAARTETVGEIFTGLEQFLAGDGEESAELIPHQEDMLAGD